MKIKAVITGDITNSTSLSVSKLSEVTHSLKELFNFFYSKRKLTGIEKKYDLFRGDSFQIVCTIPENALRLALMIRSKLISLNDSAKQLSSIEYGIDARISIGIGELSSLQPNVSNDMSKILIDSGRLLEELEKKGNKLFITTPWESKKFEMEIICLFVDSIIGRWTTKQAETVFEKLNNLKEDEIADKLKIYQSAVNQRLQAAEWNNLTKIINLFEEWIKINIK